MLEDMIGGFGTAGAGSGSISSNHSDVGIDPALVQQYISTMQKADPQYDDQAIVTMLMEMLGAPKLAQPQENNFTPAQKAAISIDAIKSQILSSWLDSVQKSNEAAKEAAVKDDIKADELKREIRKQDEKRIEATGPKSSVEYSAFLLQSTTNVRAKELSSDSNTLSIQFSGAFDAWFMHPSATADGRFPDPSFINGCLVCGPAAIQTAIGADSSILGIQLSISPAADALAVGGPASALPGDQQAAISASAMIAAMMFYGAFGAANKTNVTEAIAGGNTPTTLGFAKDFAKQIMAIVTHPLEGGDPMQNNLIRLMLSAIGLNLLYRTAYGAGTEKEGMSGKDMAALINGGDISDIPDPEVRKMVGDLVTLINNYLPEGEDARNKAIAVLSEQVDDKESADSMLETTNLFASLLNTKGIDASRLGSA